MTKLRQELREDLAAAVKSVVVSIESNDLLNEAIEKFLDTYLKEMDCWLDFDEEGPKVLVGIGPGDVAQHFRPELSVDHYGHSQDEVEVQIAAMKSFIAELEAACSDLEAQAKAGEKQIRQTGK